MRCAPEQTDPGMEVPLLPWIRFCGNHFRDCHTLNFSGLRCEPNRLSEGSVDHIPTSQDPGDGSPERIS